MSKRLRVTNLSKRKIPLITQGRVADGYWTRLVGLMGQKELAEGDGLLIDPCSSVHCFFMAIPIDVIYLDKQNRVVAIDPELKPWRLGRFHRGVKRVIELPAGTAARTGTQPGDQLLINIRG